MGIGKVVFFLQTAVVFALAQDFPAYSPQVVPGPHFVICCRFILWRPGNGTYGQLACLGHIEGNDLHFHILDGLTLDRNLPPSDQVMTKQHPPAQEENANDDQGGQPLFLDPGG